MFNLPEKRKATVSSTVLTVNVHDEISTTLQDAIALEIDALSQKYHREIEVDLSIKVK